MKYNYFKIKEDNNQSISIHTDIEINKQKKCDCNNEDPLSKCVCDDNELILEEEPTLEHKIFLTFDEYVSEKKNHDSKKTILLKENVNQETLESILDYLINKYPQLDFIDYIKANTLTLVVNHKDKFIDFSYFISKGILSIDDDEDVAEIISNVDLSKLKEHIETKLKEYFNL